jgi:di/tricarboxylate transporter
MAFGTLLGGMATLFTSSNIVVSSLLRDQGLAGFGVLDFAPLGIPLIGIGIVYMAIWGRRWLPLKSPTEQMNELSQEEADLSEVYRLNERLLQAKVPDDSALIGVSLEASRLRENYNLNLVAIQRNSKLILSPSPDFRFAKGDFVIVEGRPAEVTQESLHPALILVPRENWDGRELESEEKILIEAVLAPRSSLLGQTLRSSRFREKYDMNVLAIWRGGKPIRTRLSDETLQFGDALLLLGLRKRVSILQTEPDLIVLNYERQGSKTSAGKSWLAIAILVITLAVAALSSLPVGEVMLGGAIAMILIGIVTMDQAYRAIDWKTIFLIAGTLPLGIAIQKTGAAATIGKGLIVLFGHWSPLMYLGGLILISILLTQFLNSNTVATILTPIAIGLAYQMNVDPRSIAMGVAMGVSMNFIIPLSHPVDLFVMGPGGYQFKDFVKIGLPLTVILFLTLVILLPVIWPLK